MNIRLAYYVGSLAISLAAFAGDSHAVAAAAPPRRE